LKHKKVTKHDSSSDFDSEDAVEKDAEEEKSRPEIIETNSNLNSMRGEIARREPSLLEQIFSFSLFAK